ncbi:carboxypeptidase-like regulatory domain-containing protein [Flavobacterium sp.]|uniref:carboxypeptidase-like regulatory domain-containing protein n=1 Tax=Flavobacterium sp. TaxID=239 RepID=UPI001205D235|nr:carboxypeptidase-like regulatory domain-containing protein [Flavobacterium sp.]RZJ71792.1 MAG: T9SS type A sorting domain-containing protein [Flavobacterium sp.]
MKTFPNRRILHSLAILFFSLTLSAQKLSGTITDEEKEPLPKTEVTNLSNHFVTYSDKNGNFSIKGKKGDKLKFFHANKPTFEVEANADNKVTFAGIAEKMIAERQRLATEKPKIQKAAVTHSKGANPYKKAIIGRVSDASGPLPGATVVVLETKAKTITDVDGYFGIDAKFGQTLVVSFVGFQEARIKIKNKVVNVKLKDGGMALGEVVVTAPLTVRKKEVVSSSTEAVTVGYASAKDAKLTGKVSGLAVSADKAVEAVPRADKSEAFAAREKSSQKAGQLTAGEVNDFSKFEYWTDIASEQLSTWQQKWKMQPKFRYSVVAVNDKSAPVVGRTFYLTDDSGLKIWTAKTDNNGRAELWFHPTEAKNPSSKISIQDENHKTVIANAVEFRKGINTVKIKADCVSKPKVDIAFMVDATGSMSDEIEYLQAELSDVIKRTRAELGNAEISLSSVFYRDHGDEYVVKAFDFTKETEQVVAFIENQQANGGGDYPEAVTDALETSVNALSWNEDATSKLLFVLLDAPAHDDEQNVAKLQRLAKSAAEKGIRVVPIAASGMDKSAEYLMRSIALQTNGTYLFITNDSGIGNDHIKPTTDNYSVEMLNDLILRVIVQFSRLSGCADKEVATNKITERQISDFKWTYFPNPAKDIVTIRLEQEANGVELFDINGKLLFSKNHRSSDYTLDLSGLPNAVYYLKVATEKGILTGKIVKAN